MSKTKYKYYQSELFSVPTLPKPTSTYNKFVGWTLEISINPFRLRLLRNKRTMVIQNLKTLILEEGKKPSVSEAALNSLDY